MEDSSPLNIVVKYWVAEFKLDRTSTTDNPCVAPPIEVAMSEKIEKIHKIVLADHRMTVPEVAETIGISVVCVHNI